MDNDEKNIHMTSGGLSSETLSEDEQRPYEEKIEIPLDDSETKYDDFMFEPLGFEELEKQSELEKSRIVQQNALKFKRQKRIVVLLVLIFLSILALCIYCIVSDIISSNKSAGNLNTGKSVVLYQSHKPDTANPEYVDQSVKGVNLNGLITPYDATIKSKFLETVKESYVKGGKSWDETVEDFKDAVSVELEDVTVE